MIFLSLSYVVNKPLTYPSLDNQGLLTPGGLKLDGKRLGIRPQEQRIGFHWASPRWNRVFRRRRDLVALTKTRIIRTSILDTSFQTLKTSFFDFHFPIKKDHVSLSRSRLSLALSFDLIFTTQKCFHRSFLHVIRPLHIVNTSRVPSW